MKKLIVPIDLGMFFKRNVDMIGDYSVSFDVIDNIMNDYHKCVFEDETRRFIYYNIIEISEVIGGKREYEIENEEF